MTWRRFLARKLRVSSAVHILTFQSHMLRKSGAFTGLDFAPPNRFKNADSGSDAGSVRSGRSGVSQQQLHNIRNGAYRISRLPKGLAGTKDEINSQLKPSWDLRY
jgi:hypothetical protein